MEVEITIMADETELSDVAEVLSSLQVDSDVTMEDTTEQSVEELSEEERYVLGAVQASPGSALRVIQRTANELEGTPFDGYDQEEGWNDERETIQQILWSLRGELVQNEGQQWFPTDEAPTVLE